MFITADQQCDPIWFQTDKLTTQDCTCLEGAENSRCFEALRSQYLSRIQGYLISQVEFQLQGNIGPGKCTQETGGVSLKELLKERKHAWSSYAYAHCEVIAYCEFCGRGDPDVETCKVAMNEKRILELESELREGIEFFNCEAPRASDILVLSTERFVINLSSNCPTGLFECDTILYTGTRKSDGSKIELVGEAYYGSKPNPSFQQGYIFKNSTIHYIVTIDGKLEVIDSTSGKVLLSESGKWSW
jgi:hypothetical protein